MIFLQPFSPLAAGFRVSGFIILFRVFQDSKNLFYQQRLINLKLSSKYGFVIFARSEKLNSEQDL
jgi:hypothetical protein